MMAHYHLYDDAAQCPVGEVLPEGVPVLEALRENLDDALRQAVADGFVPVVAGADYAKVGRWAGFTHLITLTPTDSVAADADEYQTIGLIECRNGEACTFAD